MSQCIIWQTPNGAIAVSTLVPDATNEQVRAEAIRLSSFGSLGIAVAITETTLLPLKYFRKAWTWDGTQLTLDIPKCREVHLRKLRMIRDQKLKDSDVEALRAQEAQDVNRKVLLGNYRQALRDMPTIAQAMLEQAQTAENIKSVLPAILEQTCP